LRAKFTNESNFFVREVGRGSGILERTLEYRSVARERKEMMKTGSRFAHILGKKVRESLSCWPFY